MGRPGRKVDRLDGAGLLHGPGLLNLGEIASGMRAGVSPEAAYASVVPFGHRRRYAQFFTPARVADLMAEWALAGQPRTLLEPAVGMGTLVRAALARKPDLKVTAFEKDPVILRAYLSTCPDLRNLEVILGDFLTLDLLTSFDAVLMNPPYLRHHDMAYDFDIFSHFSLTYGIELSRLSNAYLLFTLKAAMSLNPGGRASIIVPTEWMNANFGLAMKTFLIKRNLLRELVYFSSCSEVFDDALTTASVLLIERDTQ